MTKRTLLLVALVICSSAQAKQDRPNIVWVVSEDNSAEWLRLYNENGAPMPNVEKLADHGLVFNNAFSCGVVCSVARSTIISGCYAPRTGTQYHRRQKPVPMPKGLKMFPYYLRQAGYYTSNCAKEDYNYDDADKAGVWDNSSKRATYQDRKPAQPFFHVQNFFDTHESCLHFPGNRISKKTTTSQDSVKLFPYHPDTPTFRYTYARYLDRHAELDRQIGRFLSKLQEDGLMDDTFIFYYGDHGGVLPRGKGYAYNNGQHPPMVVYVPKNFRHLVPAANGSRIDGFVEFTDLSATVLHLAGVRIPEGIDGRPFLGQGISLGDLNRRDTAFGYADRFDEKYDLVRTLRKSKFHYVRSYQPFNYDGLYNFYRYKMAAYREWRDLYRQSSLNRDQRRFFEPRSPEGLYDLERDPHQLHNLAGDPAYVGKLVELRKDMQQRVKSMPDLSFIPEPVFLAEGGQNPIRYGQEKKEEIARLIDIADLTLTPFPEAKPQIQKALASQNSNERYWGLIVCSTFGSQAASFYKSAEEIANLDRDHLVRTRAAEFLALTRQADPRPVLMDALRDANDEIDANLILNTVALLNDSNLGYPFDLSEFSKSRWAPKNSEASRRLEHLNKE